MTPTEQTLILATATVLAGLFVLVTYLIEWERNHRRARRFRTMLEFELDHNLEVVRDCWESVKQFYIQGVHSKPTENTPLQVAEELSTYPVLRWSRKVFEASIEWLPLALKDEEIARVLTLYAGLESLSSTQVEIRERTAEIARLKEQSLNADATVLLRITDGLDQSEIDRGVIIFNAHELVKKFKNLTQALTEGGNPLKMTSVKAELAKKTQ